MKKIGIMIALIFMVTCMSNTAFATVTNNTNPGDALTIVAADGTFTYKPSPTTRVVTATLTNDYTLLTWSTNNESNADGFAYCTASGSNDIGKASISAGAPTTLPTDGDAGTTLSGFTN
jgi:ABC-type Fe3+-hydroxamate transport system substrate-binding protein